MARGPNYCDNSQKRAGLAPKNKNFDEVVMHNYMRSLWKM